MIGEIDLFKVGVIFDGDGVGGGVGGDEVEGVLDGVEVGGVVGGYGDEGVECRSGGFGGECLGGVVVDVGEVVLGVFECVVVDVDVVGFIV